jgi:protein TonB
VKTRERREFVIGLSLALSSPLVSRKSGSGRNWKILIGCNAIILTTFWLWAQYLSRYEAAPTPQTAVESTLLAASKPSASALPPVKDNQLESPAAQKHMPRKAWKVSGQPRVQALEIPSMVQAEPGEQAGDSPESNEPVAVPANAESLMAIRKIASRAEALLSATESPVTDSGDGEPGPSGVLLPKADQPGARETVEARLIPSIKFLPVYPETARRKDIRGDVDLLVSIDEQGKVVGATVVSGPSELHAPALEAVLRWYFKPVRVDGVNAPVTGKFTMSFDEQIR